MDVHHDLWQRFALTILMHLQENIAATDKLAIDVDLRESRPFSAIIKGTMMQVSQ